ncbi:hypothetical protein J7T55_010627 [Diaporthe amygdali]|uniref:uncharacterized protein n=1 Tax=Phomopsis amygdali TaxID=1214568 RepID=UPI0022FF222F|nr:uncharacterized protein J7T55_010627 [Diaporthe amygdali]KAJ0114240.1 hypothetical protein J7T55_010627 [Diaporthe amygdali]
MGSLLASSKSSQTLVQEQPDVESSTQNTRPNSSFDDGLLPPYDEEDEDEENDGCEHYNEWHGDHWDEVDYFSSWKNWDIGDGWPHSFIRSDELSKPHDQLLDVPRHRRWLQKLSGLRHEDLPSLRVSVAGTPKIPLFKDATTGDEYSLHLHPGLLRGLDRIYCRDNLAPRPDNPTPWMNVADPLYEVRYRKTTPDEPNRETRPSLPNFIIILGSLAVRTSVREVWDSLVAPGEIVPTETTDYLVAIDAGHKDIPVWLLVSRSNLRDRAEFNGKNHPQLPVFKGLLKDDSYGYDTACILHSIRDIAGPTEFEEVCELVRKTRAVTDPGILNIEVEKMAELSGTTLPEGWCRPMPHEESPPPPPKEIVDDHLGFDPADLMRANSL